MNSELKKIQIGFKSGHHYGFKGFLRSESTWAFFFTEESGDELHVNRSEIEFIRCQLITNQAPIQKYEPCKECYEDKPHGKLTRVKDDLPSPSELKAKKKKR